MSRETWADLVPIFVISIDPERYAATAKDQGVNRRSAETRDREDVTPSRDI